MDIRGVRGILIGMATMLLCISSWLSATPLSESVSQPPDNPQIASNLDDTNKSLGDSPYGKIPLFFIRNNGQADQSVRFYERGHGHATLFTDEGVVMNLSSNLLNGSDKNSSQTRSIRLTFMGGSPDVVLDASDPLPTRVNFIQGSDKSKWRTNVPTFASVNYQGIYKGIDARFYGKGQTLEYDMIVAPGVSPEHIALSYEGVNALKIADDGALEIDLGDGVLYQSAPLVYQDIKGKRVIVDAAFRLMNSGSANSDEQGSADKFAYGFDIAAYDQAYPLIIDPSIVYSTYLGGGVDDIGHDVIVDAEEQAYIVGETTSSDLVPASSGVAGGVDAFLLKLNRQGDTLMYATYIGGIGDDRAIGVVLDEVNNSPIIVGTTSSTDFPTANPFQATLGGGTDVFVVNLDITGSTLLYSSYFGGSQNEIGRDVTCGVTGVLYLAGETTSQDFPVTASAFQPTTGGNGNPDAFVAKVDTNLSGAASLVYSSYYGGVGNESGYSVDRGTGGFVYLAGTTNGLPGFPVTANALQPTAPGSPDGFIARIDMSISGPTGLVYSSYIGGSGSDEVHAIRADGPGIIYLAGSTTSTDFPMSVAPASLPYSTTLMGTSDIFLMKLNTTPVSGNGLEYSTYIGGDGDDFAHAIDADPVNNKIYVTGTTDAGATVPYPTTPDAFQTVAGGGVTDAFFSLIDTTLGTSGLEYSSFIGGNQDDTGLGLYVTQTYGQAYITGGTFSTFGFPVSGTPYQAVKTNQNVSDAYLMRLVFLDNTPMGTGMTIPLDGGEITFTDTITTEGSTWLTSSDSGPSEPSGFKFGSPPVYYEVETTIGYNGTISVCFNYDETRFSTEKSLKLQYWNGSGWVQITTSVDTVNNRICGDATLSNEPFTFSEPDPDAIPVVSYSTEAGYDGTGGVSPGTGTTTTDFTYKVVFGNALNMAPDTDGVVVCIDANPVCNVMTLDTSAVATLRDGDFTNGEQYVYTTTLSVGTHDYMFKGTNAAETTLLPATGVLTGPDVISVLAVNTASLPGGVTGSAYSTTVTAVDGVQPYTWSLFSGSLPTGLTLNSSAGVISGMPTASGDYTFTIQVTDDDTQTASQVLSISVVAPLVVDTVSLPDGEEGLVYSTTISASGGTAPYTWSLASGSLPAGLSLDVDTGVINGTPTVGGNYSFTIQVSGAGAQVATQPLTIVVIDQPVVVTSTLPDGERGTSYTTTVAATGGVGPYTWSLVSGSLPPGLSLDVNTGVISGAPTVTNSYGFTVQVTDSGLRTATRALTIDVLDPPATVIAVGDVISISVTPTGGVAPYTWSVDSGVLQNGASLNTSTGVISGLLTDIGSYESTIRIVDANSNVETKLLIIDVVTGFAVSVDADSVITVIYAELDNMGATSATTTTEPAPLPGGYTLTDTSYDITTTANYSVSAEVCLSYTDNTWSQVKLFHWNGTSWDDITTSVDSVNYIVCGDTTSFSPFAVGGLGELSTAITLDSFNVTQGEDQALIEWVTLSEVDNYGFRVLRSDSQAGDFTPLEEGLIPALGGPGLSMNYSYIDTTVEPGKQYYYRLQDIDTSGLVTAHAIVPLMDQSVKYAALGDKASEANSSTKQSAAGRMSATTESKQPVQFARAGMGSGTTQAMQQAVKHDESSEDVVNQTMPTDAAMSRAASTIVAAPRPHAMTHRTQAYIAPQQRASNKAAELARQAVLADADKPSPGFAVAIEDSKGNVVNVSHAKVSKKLAVKDGVPQLDIDVSKGQSMLSWQVQALTARGFIVLRAEQGSKVFEPVIDFVPNFARGETVYEYNFTDISAKSGKKYQYRLELSQWGVQTAALH